MTTLERVMFFFVLPILAVLLYPPTLLVSGVGVLVVVVAFFIGLGVLLLRGRALALTFSIFMQGLNVIVRLMMFWSNGFDRNGVANLPFIIATVLGMGLSIWLLLRLDRQDVHVVMVR